jgi:sporulation protein YlmC with PRC-barrel domain
MSPFIKAFVRDHDTTRRSALRRALSVCAIWLLPKSATAAPPADDSRAEKDFLQFDGSSRLVSRMIGLQVYTAKREVIGQIEDVAIDPAGGKAAYILSVANLLGLSQRWIAVRPAAITIDYITIDGKWQAVMNASPDEIAAAPEYQYPDHIAGKACIDVLH